jgi:uncharacterized membrane protein YhaH (DUF805 family)
MNDRLQAATSGRSVSLGRGGWRWLDGRANRKEYWLWVGPLTLIGSILVLFGISLGFLVMGLPVFFFWIRRLHDLGVSGWIAPLTNIGLAVTTFAFTATLEPTLAVLMMLLARVTANCVMGVLPGQRVANRFGLPTSGSNLAQTFS